MDLFAAAGAGDLDLVRKLITEGAKPNLGDTWTGESIRLVSQNNISLEAGLPCTRPPRLVMMTS